MTNTVKMSSKGQVVIPAAIRQALTLNEHSEFIVTVVDGDIVLSPLPTTDDWAELFKNIPHEDVALDENGNYDPKKVPEFHDWMING